MQKRFSRSNLSLLCITENLLSSIISVTEKWAEKRVVDILEPKSPNKAYFCPIFALFSLENTFFSSGRLQEYGESCQVDRIWHISSFSIDYFTNEMHFWPKISWNLKFQAFFTNFDLSSTAWFNCEPSNSRKGPDELSL